MRSAKSMRANVKRMTVAVMMEGVAVARERNCSGRLIQAVHMRSAYPLPRFQRSKATTGTQRTQRSL